MNLLASLRYLVALHEHRHFGRAAQACHITQPALSNALRALEKEFGVVVVRRGRSFEGFTPEGERVLATAQRMLHEHQVLQQDMLALQIDRRYPYQNPREYENRQSLPHASRPARDSRHEVQSDE